MTKPAKEITMKATKLLFLSALMAAPNVSLADETQPSDTEQVSRIAAMPLAQCQRDLTKLHDIYGQMKNMTTGQAQEFLHAIADDVKRRGLQIPPPPKPCSTPHLALESRCGNVSDAESKCQQGGAPQ